MNTFESEVWNELKQMNNVHGFFSWRLFDTKSFFRITRYAPKQPADFCAFWRGKPYLFELKSQKNEPSFISSKVMPHQMEDMSRSECSGGLTFFLLNRRSTPRNYRCYAIKPTILKDLTKERKSVRWDVIEKNSIVIPRKGQTWELSALFDRFPNGCLYMNSNPQPSPRLSPSGSVLHEEP